MNLVRFAHNWNNGILEYWNNGVRGMKGFKNGHAHGVIQLFFPTFHHSRSMLLKINTKKFIITTGCRNSKTFI